MASLGLMPSAILASVVETALNGYLSQDVEVRSRLSAMEGRVIAFDLVGLGVVLYVRPGAEGVQVSDRCVDEPDVILRGTPPVMARLAIDSMAEPSIELIGDVSLGQGFGQLLADVQPDWEEKLSAVFGDVAAHELGKLFRSARAWSAETRRTLEANLGEYLQEERRDVPASAEVTHFLDGVVELRSDLDRLAARIRRLESLAGPRSE